MENKVDEIKNSHLPGYAGLFRIYTPREIFSTFPFLSSVVQALILVLVLMDGTNCNSKAFVLLICSNILNSFPDLLGFNLGCYTLILGLGSSNFVNALTKPKKNKPYSLYQRTIAVFAFSISLQAIGLLLAYSISTLGGLNLSNFGLFDKYYFQINSLIIFFLLIISIWAIMLVLYLVKNLFSYGQLTHFFIAVDRLKSEKKNKPETPE